LLAALGVPVFRCPGFEADDVLATLAQRARDAEAPALVVSGDRDLLQLAHGSVRVHYVGARGKDAVVYDEAAVLTRFGVPPQHLPSYVALVGDPSDNLPGVPGIGSSTAQKLLAGKGSCQELLDQVVAVKSTRVREALLAHRQQILSTESLARLREDAPIDSAHELSSAPSADALRAVSKLFQEVEIKSLQGRLEKLSGRVSVLTPTSRSARFVAERCA